MCYNTASKDADAFEVVVMTAGIFKIMDPARSTFTLDSAIQKVVGRLFNFESEELYLQTSRCIRQIHLFPCPIQQMCVGLIGHLADIF